MLAYITQLFSLVYFFRVGLYIVSYIFPLFCFCCYFCNKFETWWLYQSSTIKLARTATMSAVLTGETKPLYHGLHGNEEPEGMHHAEIQEMSKSSHHSRIP